MTTITMENYWHPIATSGEVLDQPKQFKLLGEKIVAFRDDSGVVAFKDLCIHRGAALSRGRIKHGRLACPYHGWEYDRTGACVHIPSLLPGSAIPRKARAIVYQAREAYGLLWVAMREPARPFPTWPDNAWDNPKYHVFLINQYLWKASAGRVIENAMDFSHFNFVHAGYTELADGPIIKPHEVERTERGLAYVYEDTRIRREYELDFPFLLHDTKKVIAVGKGHTWSETSDTREGDATILSFIASPVDENTSRLYAFMARNHSIDKPDSSFAEGFDTLTEQDRVVVESQRPEQIPADISAELHLRYPDAASVLYRRLLREVPDAEAYVLLKLVESRSTRPARKQFGSRPSSSPTSINKRGRVQTPAERSGKRDTKIRPWRQEAEEAPPLPNSAHGDQLISAKPRGTARFLSDLHM